jgi:hypothetical protein
MGSINVHYACDQSAYNRSRSSIYNHGVGCAGSAPHPHAGDFLMAVRTVQLLAYIYNSTSFRIAVALMLRYRLSVSAQ